METRRFVIVALLGVVLFLFYQAWQKDYGDGARLPETAQPATANLAAPTAAPATSAAGPGKAPAIGTPAPETPSLPAQAPTTPSATVHVQTDLLGVEIGLRGAGLNRVVLEKYPYSKDSPKRKLALLTDRVSSPKQPYFVFQTGLAGVKQPIAGGTTEYTAAKKNYELAKGVDTLDVPLTYEAADGNIVAITYHFHRGSYVIGLTRKIVNNSGQALHAGPYARWLRNDVQAGTPQKFVHTYFGMGVYQQDGSDYKFKKMELTDLDDEPYSHAQAGGWLAMLQQYFIAAIIPAPVDKVTYTAKPAGNGHYFGQVLGKTVIVAPGASHSFDTRLYIGPKLQGKLDGIAPGLALTEDYGLFTPIAKPLFWVLSKLHDLTGNWGWSIILLTLIIRGLFFKLSESQYRSMAKMRKFGPRIKQIKEQNAGDRERLNKAMMDLYKKEKFNPLAGCWPMLLQFPVFIALYYVLIESVELRQASFIFWLQDLSSPDPLYILPVLYGISMWFQQRLSGQTATMEATQQKIMNVMPIGLAAFFSMFPSGLVLYYVVSNAFTIIQQWIITRRLDREGLSHR